MEDKGFFERNFRWFAAGTGALLLVLALCFVAFGGTGASSRRSATAPSQAKPSLVHPIGAGVDILDAVPPLATAAAVAPGVKLPYHQVGLLTPVIRISAPSQPSGQLRLRFTLNRTVATQDIVFVATAEAPNGPWTLLHATPSSDKRHVEVMTNHFSWWQVIDPMDSLKALQASLTTITKGALGSLTSDIFQMSHDAPDCAAKKTAASDGYQLTHVAGKDTLLTCFGMEDGKRVLSLVNNRPYALYVQHPGFDVEDGGALAADVQQLARLGSKGTTIAYPGDTVKYSVDLSYGKHADVSTEFDGAAEALYNFEIAAEVVIAIGAHYGGPEVKAGSRQFWKTLDEIVSQKDCLSAVNAHDFGAILVQCFKDTFFDVLAKNGAAAANPVASLQVLVDGMMTADAMIVWLRSQFGSVIDDLRHRDEFSLRVTRKLTIDPFVGKWYRLSGNASNQALFVYFNKDASGGSEFGSYCANSYCLIAEEFNGNIVSDNLSTRVNSMDYEAYGEFTTCGDATCDTSDRLGKTSRFRLSSKDMITRTYANGATEIYARCSAAKDEHRCDS